MLSLAGARAAQATAGQSTEIFPAAALDKLGRLKSMSGQTVFTVIVVLAVLIWLAQLVWLYMTSQEQRLDPIRTVSGAAIFFIAAAPVARMSPSIVDAVGGFWESLFSGISRRGSGEPAYQTHQPAHSQAPARLLIDGNQHALSGQRIRLGRYPNNEIVIDNSTVSAYHAEIIQRPDGRHEITDRDSRNGTRVNGAIVLSQVLKDGDLITLGGASMHYLAPSVAEPQHAVPAYEAEPEPAHSYSEQERYAPER